jgi:predicted AAA+ superfamily ATPase
LIIDGARQTGKSFIIREVGQRLFPNFIEINMEEDKLQDRLFADARTVADFYMALSVVAGERMGERRSTLVFIDEIQAYDHLLTLLKFLNADRRFTFVASGSMLGVALRQTSSLPVGSIRIEHMYPMDFEEFLWANGVGEELISAMRRAFEEARPLPQAIHAKVLDLMRKYLLVGGMPAAVNAYVSTQNIQEVRSIQTDISAMYGIDASKYEETRRQLRRRV